VADEELPGSRVERWVSIGATIVAPVTVLSALLFYFGYVSSRSQYAYFGVDVDTIGLSTQDYVMRSPQPLLVPLLVLTLAGAGILMLDAAVRRRTASAVADAANEANAAKPELGPAQYVEQIRHMAHISVIFGLALLTAGVVLIFTYALVRDWAFYGIVTPLLLGLGVALIAYASRVLNLLQYQQARPAPATAKDSGPTLAGLAHTDSTVLVRRSANVLIYVLIAASIFWITATVAQWSGRGLAEYDAQHFDSLPSVILDTKERLFLRDPGIEETALPASQGQTFHYRYRHLRLLIEGHDRMFLVPDDWSASDSTLIVPLDESVRVQFQFQNQPP
jgi:hypothetical protein